MTQIQLTLNDEESKIVEFFKIVSKSETKQEAIKKMILFFNVDIKYKNKKVVEKCKN